jgi:hypothetical protein|tara:strand:+ start:208 stop:1314 length:1107 start_codon:yes stop_codon:yes gene_type:complete
MAKEPLMDEFIKPHALDFTTKVKVTTSHVECQTFCDLKNVEYAFYLVVDGITVSKQWYKDEPICSFRLEHDRTKEHSIVFFVRDLEGKIHKKTQTINHHDVDFIPFCSFDGQSIRCKVDTAQKNAEYAFYLYLNNEEVVKKWYTAEKSVVFEIGDAPIHRFEVKYFVRDEELNVFSKTNGFERHQPRTNQHRARTNFDFFLSFDGETIYKKVNPENQHFPDKLHAHGGVERFRQILDTISTSQISNHVAKGFGIENNGSYKSKYIHGYRLDLLASVMKEYPSLHLPSNIERGDIKIQCERLILALKEEDSAGELTGDWALHNLIYSPTENCIFNIDLEGFITYNPLPKWASLDKIIDWIEELLSLLGT